jgi:regulator of Ty1 transposition protein 103
LLYLANDIVQNSKKDSGRYVNEFWRVIPAALNDVFVNGDDFGRNVVQRLVCEENIVIVCMHKSI